jgi:1,4-dihydroxy-2-naphthoate octaprenyltransferase
VPNPWVLGARVRTLPAAVVPVAVGTGVALHEGQAVWWKALLALVVSLALQVGVNYANDYSDGVRGTDDARVGPPRLVGGGLKPPTAVKRAAVLAGWFYTGGPKPYGYAGLGELFVFVFFGVVATAGAAFVQTGELTALALVASVPVGMLACALLVVNNLRDIPGDTVSGKQTMAVRLGDGPTRSIFVALLVLGCALAAVVAAVAESPWPVVAVGALVPGLPGLRAVRHGAKARDLIPVLGATGKVQMAFGALLTVGLALP